MEFFNNFITHIQHLDQRKFYSYCGGFIGSVATLSILILILYYRSASQTIAQIEVINGDRERVQKLLTEYLQVQKQKLEVHKMIEQDEYFNILEYFQLTLAKIGLDNHVGETKSARTEREDNYAEEDLKAQLTDMTMKQLTELLQEIEKNRRLFFKELEITKSKKRPNTIEISLTIATLIKKV